MNDFDLEKAKYPPHAIKVYETMINETKIAYAIFAMNRPDNPHYSFEHTHAGYEFIFCLKGKATCIAEKKAHELQVPYAIMIPPGVRHMIQFDDEKSLCFSLDVMFREASVSGVRRVMYNLTKGETDIASCTLGEETSRLILEMHRAGRVRKAGYFTASKVNACFTLVFTNILELMAKKISDFSFLSQDKSVAEESTDHVYYQLLLKQITDYINIYCHYPLSIHELADATHMSVGNLQRILKKSTGKSFTELLRNARINKTKALIHSQKYSLKDIAYMSGYTSYENFFKQFKQIVGVPPQEYRQAWEQMQQQ